MADAQGRRGLGRGLSALLDEAQSVAPGPASEATGERQLPIELLRRNPDQPRRSFGEAELAELADSIRERGVLQPILVRPAPGAAGEYQIVAGERRWRAAQQAGLHAVPVLVRDYDDAAVAEIAIIENVQRADLNPVEEAQGYRTLMARFGRTQDAVAKTVGKSRSHVANTLRLLNLPSAVREHLEAGRITAGHARAIATARDPEDLAREIIDRDLTVRQAEQLAKPLTRERIAEVKEVLAEEQRHEVARRAKDADTAALEQDLSDALGLTVEIRDWKGAGEVRVRYASLEQLDIVCQRLGGR